MISLKDRLPAYLLGKGQIITTVIVTALFTLIYLMLTVPFSPEAWFRLEAGGPFLFTVSYLFLSTVVVVLSRMSMYSCRTLGKLTFLHYVLWLAAEVVVLALILALFTGVGFRHGMIPVNDGSFVPTFAEGLLKAAFCIGVPSAGCGLYFALQDRNNTIRVMNYGDVVGDIDLPPFEQKRITLFDNNGVLRFSINSENLYFIESDDNYIQVWYRDSSGAVKKYMLRCRLKTIEESFADSGLMRCHRKYVVNMRNIRILKSERDGYQIDLGLEGVAPLPISKTYEQAVLARFNSQQY